MLSLDRQNHWREVYRREHPAWRPATELYAALVRSSIRPDSRFLDLGCGRGGLIEQLNHPLSRSVGVDPDLASLREHRLPDFPRVVALSAQLPLAPHAFDVIAASWLLEHLPEPLADFRAVSRVLRPGGAFVFITPNARHPLSWANRLAGRLGQTQGRLVARLYGRAAADTFPTTYHANTPHQLRQLFHEAGLQLELLLFVGDPTYLAFNRFFFRLASRVDQWLPPNRHIHLVGLARKTARQHPVTFR